MARVFGIHSPKLARPDARRPLCRVHRQALVTRIWASLEEVGVGVNRIKVGDRVSVPFNLACGTCRNCNDGLPSACLRANPSGQPGAGYGYPAMGPYWGGQAEYLRVPWADFNLLELPAGTENESDFTMLSDIFPTGYYGTAFTKGIRIGCVR